MGSRGDSLRLEEKHEESHQGCVHRVRHGELRTTEKLRTGNVICLWGNQRVTTQRMHRKKLIHVMKMALNKCCYNGHILQEMAQVKNRTSDLFLL